MTGIQIATPEELDNFLEENGFSRRGKLWASLLDVTYKMKLERDSKKQIVGLARALRFYSHSDKPTFGIYDVLVAQKLQRRGIGTKVVKGLIQTITDSEKNPIIFVEALPEAEKFYKKMGFEGFENPVDGREFMFYGGRKWLFEQSIQIKKIKEY